MCAAWATLSSLRNSISGATRSRSARPTRPRRCVATLSSPSKVAARCGVGAEHADEDLGVPEVAGDLDRRDRHEPHDAGILDVVGEEGGDLLAHRRGDAIGAVVFSRHDGNRCGRKACGEPVIRQDHRLPARTIRRQPWGADSSVRATSSVR